MELYKLAGHMNALTFALMSSFVEDEAHHIKPIGHRNYRKTPSPANMKKTKDRALVKARRKQKHQK